MCHEMAIQMGRGERRRMNETRQKWVTRTKIGCVRTNGSIHSFSFPRGIRNTKLTELFFPSHLMNIIDVFRGYLLNKAQFLNAHK